MARVKRGGDRPSFTKHYGGIPLVGEDVVEVEKLFQ